MALPESAVLNVVFLALGAQLTHDGSASVRRRPDKPVIGQKPSANMIRPRIHLSVSAQRKVYAVQSAALVILLLGGTAFFASWVNQFYPLKNWLFFHYARAWLCVSIFVLASLCAGWRLCAQLVPRAIATSERVILSLALGVLLFFYGLFIGGVFNCYGRLFFVLWPLLLLGYGGPVCFSDLFVHWRHARASILSAAAPRSAIQFIAAAWLLVGIVGIYLQVLNPNNLSYDARWYHLPIAEAYAAAGGIQRFNEGWYLGTYPQLANLLYTWAFLAPGGLFEHVLICAHIEFALFVATLFACSILAARLIRRDRLPFAAVVVFLFPEIFAYDSNLNGGADHVLAFWTAVLGIALIRLGSEFSKREATLCGLIMGGALLTKYQAVYVFVPAALLVLSLAARKRRRQAGWVWAAVVVVCTAPHWVKNWIYYNDPIYPLLHRYLASRPFHVGAGALLQEIYWPKQFDLVGPTSERILSTLRGLFSFSFVPNDWPEFHGNTPIFGSLFTLTLPLLLFLRASRRLWLTVLGVHVGLATWYALSHQDRFLQALLPWMAAATAATLALAWDRGAVVKVAVGLIVLLQWVWGSDVYFFRTHSMSGDSPIRATGDFLGAAHRGNYDQRFSLAPTFEKISAILPKGAHALFHRDRLRLGFGIQLVEDAPGWQGAIEYLSTESPGATFELLRTIGVTHALWGKYRPALPRADVAREAVFARFIAEYITDEKTIDGWQVGTLRSEPSNVTLANAPTTIAWLVCNSDAVPGQYTPQGLAAGQPAQTFSSSMQSSNVKSELSASNVAVTRAGCQTQSAELSVVSQEFLQAGQIGDLALWTRVKLAAL